MDPKQQPPYPLRISPELRAKLENEASAARRSLNAEIAARLEASFSQTGRGESSTIALAKLEHMLAETAMNEAALRATTNTIRHLLQEVVAKVESGETIDPHTLGKYHWVIDTTEEITAMPDLLGIRQKWLDAETRLHKLTRSFVEDVTPPSTTQVDDVQEGKDKS